MSVRTFDEQTTTDLAQRYYACKRCGAEAEVAVFARRADADTEMALAKCPTCRLPQPGAVARARLRIGLWFALALVLEFFGRAGELVSIAPLALGAAQVWRERGRFRRARGAVFSKVTPGQLPAPPPAVRPAPLAPPPDLPTARAIAAPVHRDEPKDPASGPRFLVEK